MHHCMDLARGGQIQLVRHLFNALRNGVGSIVTESLFLVRPAGDRSLYVGLKLQVHSVTHYKLADKGFGFLPSNPNSSPPSKPRGGGE
jgi:hypothetical protein